MQRPRQPAAPARPKLAPALAALIGAISACLIPTAPARADEAAYQVGVAAVDITPEYPVRLNGFGFRREESEGVRRKIYAKALAITHGDDKPALLITVDGLGVPDSLTTRLARTLQDRAGLPPQRLAIAASHTHTAPMIVDVAPTIFGVPIPPEHQARIERYSREFEVKLLEVALTALENQQPGTLSWSVGTATFAKNRRRQGGPVDHSLPMLAVRDPAGKLRAVLVTYACHCVSLRDNQISGDWAGYAQEFIERQHPGCIALFSAGCGADSNPIDEEDRVKSAHQHGLEIAHEVERLLQAESAAVTGPITAKHERITLPLAPLPSRQEWETRAEADTPVGHHARTQLARLDRGEALITEISYPVQSWAFGDSLAMAFLPGEVVCDYSVRLKKELDASRLWLHAYANACPGYIPSERVLKEGGYEGGSAMTYYDIPGPYAPGLEQKIVDAVLSQIGKTFAPSEQPAQKQSNRTQGTVPLAPQRAVAALQPRPGMRVELVAAEPLVASPVAIDFGPDGRLWVAEMYDYPQGVDGLFAPGGRIKTLFDDDADGRFDRAEVFLEGIPFPTGVTVYRDGVLISAAPDILFARDTNGDGKADDVQKLYSGFATHNYQARVNSLEYGLDGWIYGACGLFGGDIISPATGETLNLGGRDFRIRPDSGLIEPASGRTQQGRARDDWQNWFGCTNSALLLHFPQQDHHLRRNPNFAPPNPVVNAAAGSDPGRVYPIAETVRFKLSGESGRVTAACGLGIYRDDLLGPDFTGNAFICEPVGNVVHRRVLSPQKTTFAGYRAPDEATSEFLASRDNWFRPVQARTGPDGALWIVDMYRYVIEHPVWIPPDTLAQLDVRAGAERGRIYRVLPENTQPRSPTRLDRLDTPELVAALETPNGWQRDMAMQLLLWRQDASAAPALTELTKNSPRPVTRMQALCTLAELDALPDDLLARALHDTDPGVRRHAVRLAVTRQGDSQELADALLARFDDADPHVQLQLAYSLGEWNDPRSAAALADLVLRHHAEPYIRAAVMSSLNPSNVARVLLDVQHHSRRGDSQTPPAVQSLVTDLIGQAAALAPNEDLPRVVQGIASAELPLSDRDRFTQMASFLESLARARRKHDDCLDEAAKDAVLALQTQARTVLKDPAANDALLQAAAGYLARLSSATDDDVSALAQLLQPHRSLAVQRSALTALARTARDSVPGKLLARWSTFSPQLRGDVLDALLNREAWLSQLLDSLEAKQVTAADIDVARQQRITQHPSAAIRARAAKLLSGTTNADRRRLIDEYTAAMPPQGDPEHGRDVFEKHCANCHKLQGKGHEVGPDLAPYATKPREALVIAVLDPNQAIDPRYHAYAAALVDGRVLSGIVVAETATSLSLAAAEGKTQEILRVDMEELRNTGKSLMPEGLEKEISPAALADLCAWFGGLTVPVAQPAPQQPKPAPPSDPASIARYLLNDDVPAAERTELIAKHPKYAAEIIAVMSTGFRPGTPEEYRRIPWLWRVSVAAGQGEDLQEIKEIVPIALPQPSQPLDDWRAVVVGGGLINGISQRGLWPRETLEGLIKDHPALLERWHRANALSIPMSHDPQIKAGTRYDALRMVAMLDWNEARPVLLKYLGPDQNAELQMGSVSGLVDVPHDEATALLVEHMPHYTERNRNLALDGLLRTPQRTAALLDALASGVVTREHLGDERTKKLLEHPSEPLRTRARALLAP